MLDLELEAFLLKFSIFYLLEFKNFDEGQTNIWNPVSLLDASEASSPHLIFFMNNEWNKISKLFVFFFRNVLPAIHQWHQHVLQSVTIQKPLAELQGQPAAAEAAPAAAVQHELSVPASAQPVIPTIRGHSADLQLPRLQEQSNLSAGLFSDSVPTGELT